MKKDNLQETTNLVKKVLDSDGLVVIPSDTVYVSAARADSPKAVKKILDFKGRQFNKGISVFLRNFSEIKKYAYYSKNQAQVIKTLLPGFFTIVLDSKHRLASQLEPPDGTIGIRIVDNNFINCLLDLTGFPITATSANLSGRPPHYSVSSLLATLSKKKKKLLTLIVDFGRLPRNLPSTVVRLTAEKIKVIRKGLLNPKLILEEKTGSEIATGKFAQRVYQKIFKKYLKNQAVLLIMQGDLGAGKTVFAKGIGELFGQQFTSPTFVLLDEYRINKRPLKNIYHLDLFRVESEEEIEGLKLESFLEKGNLMLVEWGEKLSTLPKLKNDQRRFFLLQIEEKGEKIRLFKLYQL